MIFAVIAAAILLLLRTTLSVHDVQDRHGRDHSPLQETLDRIAAELEFLVPPGSNRCQTVFEQDHLAFCSLRDEPAGLQSIDYRRRPSGDLARGQGTETNVLLRVATFVAEPVDTDSTNAVPAMVRIRLGDAADPAEREVFIPASLRVRSSLRRQ